MGTSRATLRRAIGRLCGDLIVATATDTGTDTTLVDSTNLVAGDDALVGRQLYPVAGTAANLGKTRRVSGNAEATGTATVSVAWPAATAAGDVVECYASRSVSPTPEEIHDKINDVIRAVADVNLLLTENTPAAFDAADPYIDLPAGWVGFVKAMWQDGLGIWHDVPKATTTLHRFLGSYGQVELTGEGRWLADGREVMLVGVSPASELSSDSATTTINPDWIVKQSAGELLIQNARTYEDPAGAERRGNLWLQQASSSVPRVMTRPPAYRRLNRS